MSRWRIVAGFVVGALLVASAAAHSLLGWRQLRGELAQSQVPLDLSRVLGIGWHFGGAAMLAFGVMVIGLFSNALRGRRVSLKPALVIGILYVLFGLWALTISDMNPFFLLFVVPGVVLVVAAWRPIVPVDPPRA